jgi:hypothetical protein
MSWQRRLLELVSAGGALSAAGCNFGGSGGGCGNGLPDPCICDRTPLDAGQCVAEAKCRAEGDRWELFPTEAQPDAAPGYLGVCLQPDAPRRDAAIDAPTDAAVDAPSD